MKKIFTFLVAALLLLPFTSYAAVYVRGYTKSNGTYVAPHYRSNPDGNPYNNWSYPGNTNPYTGKTATGNSSTYLYNYYNGSSASGVSGTYYNPTSYTSSIDASGSYTYSNPVSTYTPYTYIPQPIVTKSLPEAVVPYTVKLWVDNNPTASCATSTFLRNTEKTVCTNYKNNLANYSWITSTKEYDGIHYYYNSSTGVTTSCPDGYAILFSTSTGLPTSCRVE